MNEKSQSIVQNYSIYSSINQPKWNGSAKNNNKKKLEQCDCKRIRNKSSLFLDGFPVLLYSFFLSLLWLFTHMCYGHCCLNCVCCWFFFASNLEHHTLYKYLAIEDYRWKCTMYMESDGSDQNNNNSNNNNAEKPPNYCR